MNTREEPNKFLKAKGEITVEGITFLYFELREEYLNCYLCKNAVSCFLTNKVEPYCVACFCHWLEQNSYFHESEQFERGRLRGAMPVKASRNANSGMRGSVIDRLEKYKVEIQGLLDSGSTQHFIAMKYGTSASNVHQWLKHNASPLS